MVHGRDPRMLSVSWIIIHGPELLDHGFFFGEFCHVFFANCLSLLLIFSVNDSKKIKQMPTGPSKKIRICCFSNKLAHPEFFDIILQENPTNLLSSSDSGGFVRRSGCNGMPEISNLNG